MFRNQFKILMIAVITISCDSSNKQEYIKNDGINGMVKDAKYESFSAMDSFGIIMEAERIYGVGGTDNRHVFLENGESKYVINYWEGVKEDSSIFKFNSIENHEITETYGLNGVLYQKFIQTKNDVGKVESASIYNRKGDLELKWIYTYPNDTLIKTKTLSGSKSDENDEIQTTLIMNSYDQPIKEIRFRGDNFLDSYKYEYYENGLEKTTIIKYADNDDSTYKTEYEYDQNGSWIRKIIYVNDNPKYIVRRTLNYY